MHILYVDYDFDNFEEFFYHVTIHTRSMLLSVGNLGALEIYFLILYGDIRENLSCENLTCC